MVPFQLILKKKNDRFFIGVFKLSMSLRIRPALITAQKYDWNIDGIYNFEEQDNFAEFLDLPCKPY